MTTELELLCFAIDNLETQLSMAKKQRDVLMSQLHDQQFITDTIECAEYWMKNYRAQHSKANLRNVLHNLSLCKCCERHTQKRPSVESYDNGNIDNYMRRSTPKTGDNLMTCRCRCRSYARGVCRILDELE